MARIPGCPIPLRRLTRVSPALLTLIALVCHSGGVGNAPDRRHFDHPLPGDAMAQDDRGADRPAEQSRPAADAGPEQVAATVAELYDSLRALAAGYLRRERPDHTLQPTALVHEAYMKLSQQDGLRWNDRLHFFHIASAQIRRILVDHARTRGRHKRGGQFVRVTFDENLAGDDGEFDLVDLDQVLDRLDRESATDRQIVELKFFGGLTEPEIGEVLGISERTVRRRWLFARTWLLRELSRDGDPA